MRNCTGTELECLAPLTEEGFGLFFGLGVGLSLSVVTILLFVLFCLLHFAHAYRQASLSTRFAFQWRDNHFTPHVRLLHDDTIQSFPWLLYSKIIRRENAEEEEEEQQDDQDTTCSVCLADYGENDVLRVMPHCGHRFHLECGDRWLRVNPTCPICRHWQVPKKEMVAEGPIMEHTSTSYVAVQQD
ncbi:hypothetical protein ACFE04_009262 [Oxalis oulophora]